eukprot:scaffold158021_cov21-Tisochrysis_lutea.AAC.1
MPSKCSPVACPGGGLGLLVLMGQRERKREQRAYEWWGNRMAGQWKAEAWRSAGEARGEGMAKEWRRKAG